jgi:hypothetical protein
MKKKIFTAIALCLVAICGMSQTSDMLYIKDFNIDKEGKKSVGVLLDNPENAFCAFQFDLWLPVGTTIALDDSDVLDVNLNNLRKKSNHSLTVERLANGYYRFVCFSMTNRTFSGNSGAIVVIKVESDNSLQEGAIKTGSIDNIILTMSDGKVVKPEMRMFSVEINNSTGISQVNAAEDNAEIFDISGKKIQNQKNLKNGVYIKNGRKVFVGDKGVAQ